MKKVLLSIIAAVLLFQTAGCSGSREIAVNNDGSKTGGSEIPISSSEATHPEKSQLKIDYTNPSTDSYKDGVYHARFSGKEPGLEVTVIVKNNKISEVKVDSSNETKGYSDEALEITPLRIVARNSIEVDSVSGVTETVEGIKGAVKKALKDAKLSNK